MSYILYMKINPHDANWFSLVVSLPTQNATLRMRLWRAVKTGGCAVLRDGVYLLPANESCTALFSGLAQEVLSAGGSAQLLAIAARDDLQEQDFRALFERGERYAALLAEIARVHSGLPERETTAARKAMKTLRRDFDALSAIDFFPGAAKAQAEAALVELEHAAMARYSPGEPRAATGRIVRLERAPYQGRLWATRRHLWVDRMASAWLIRRFIDPAARFAWLEKPEDSPDGALGFDFDGASFTHVGEKVTFEVLLASLAPENDGALAKLAGLVHFLDVGGIPVAEAAGVEAVLAGARQRCGDDDLLLAEASKVFDFLYAAYVE